MKKLTSLLLVAGTVLALVPQSAMAEHGRREPHRWGGDIHRFHERDLHTWRGGRWHRGHHEGRLGWWWIVGPTWYYYAAPVYPYPDPYTPPTVVVETVQAVPTAPAVQRYWYCTNPQGYFPYVPLCYDAWQRVEMAPATTTVITTPSAPATTAAPAMPEAPALVAPVPEPQSQGDYKQLNGYSAELAQIDMDSKDAENKLRHLAKKVEDFRKSLLKRDYNAMNILRDTEDLKDRIAEQREELRKKK